MFDLNEYISEVSLDTINVVTLTYYSLKSEVMNIYDTNFEFDENIVPLATSVLEINPSIINVKRYSNINSESIIIIGNQNEVSNKSQISYPCFFSDLQKYNGNGNGNISNMQNIQGYSKKLINTIDINHIDINHISEDNGIGIENGIENQNNLLVKMYKLENKKGEFSHSILNEEELTIIVWTWEYANFQIIINKQTPQTCHLQINIYITENNKIILSKLETINNIIEKINKIKNEMVSRVK